MVRQAHHPEQRRSENLKFEYSMTEKSLEKDDFKAVAGREATFNLSTLTRSISRSCLSINSLWTLSIVIRALN